MSGLTFQGQAQEIDSRWRLRMMDSKENVKVEATIRFLEEPATESCMAGTWKRVIVEEKLAYDEKFFPLAEPLAYRLKDGELTLGRTAVCDRYLFMYGRSDVSTIRGSYGTVNISGSQKLGSFTLKRFP